MSAAIETITLENAQALLIDESFKRPVVVDFWADWCAPCKTLMPILEKLAGEYAGQFLLAKVNTEEQQMLASQFGVRSLPTVMVIKDGQPVDGFAGAQTETEVRAMLDKYLPKPWDLQLQQAQQLMAEGSFEQALPLLNAASQAARQRADIALVLSDCLIELKRLEQAAAMLAAIKLADQNQYFEQLQAKLELAQKAGKTPEVAQLEAQLEASPGDQNLALQLAVQYSQQSYHKEALELLYGILQAELNFADGEARKAYTDILAQMGKGDPLAVAYQRKLYTLLH